MLAQAPSLLITDDDREFRETLQGVFESRGFRTIGAGDGQEAVEIVRRQEVHLLLLDMHMPRLTGLETLRVVKQLKSRLPCILLSAALDEAMVRAALLAQAFTVLAKPVSCVQLTSIVEGLMRSTYDWPPRRAI